MRGPFACGCWPDLVTSKKTVMGMLSANERVIADNCYTNSKYLTPSTSPDALAHIFSTIRAGQENVNRRIKQFQSVSRVFRHNLKLHGLVFHATAKSPAIMTNKSDRLLEVKL